MIALGDRMKEYEHKNENRIKAYEPFLIRLDGNNFSKFTKGFKQPFDDNFVFSMIQTMNDLLTKFNARTGYTHSDEITLIFDKICTKDEYDEDKSLVHNYNGRIEKILTLVSGYCSVRFNYYIKLYVNADNKSYKTQFLDKINSDIVFFDARIIMPHGEFVNHMIWRSVCDCYRNCVACFARKYFSAKKLHKKIQIK